MAVDEDEDSKRVITFLCLTTVRGIVAAVVAVLAAAVVIMVIIVGVNPGNIEFSVLQGHVLASNLWWRTPWHVPSEHGLPEPRGGEDEPGECLRCPRTRYMAAGFVYLRFTLSAYNPSGRSDITCDNIALRVLDMPDPDAPSFNLSAMMVMDEFRLPTTFKFQVKRQSSHTLRRQHTISNRGVLSYIVDMYGGMRSFSAMVQVNATITSQVTRRRKNVSHLCWPVTVGMDEPSSSAKATTCKPSEEVNYGAVAGTVPPPAPAPAPTMVPAG